MAEGDNERILRVNIDEEMKSAYIDYSMSVIVATRCSRRFKARTPKSFIRNAGFGIDIQQVL
jgi:hypothetical protein